MKILDKNAALVEAIHSLNFNVIFVISCLVLAFLLHFLVVRLKYFLLLSLFTMESPYWTKPKHLGIIMDGNRRFAKNQGLETNAGHKKGSEKLKEVLRWCYDVRIKIITVWAFSVENFSRDKQEVEELFQLMHREFTALKDHEVIRTHQVRVKIVGERQLLPPFLQETIQKLEYSTAHYNQHIFNIAVGYGGREEVATSAKSWMLEEISKTSDLETLKQRIEKQTLQETAERLNSHTYFASQPEVDLIIRTSGENRLSGFMLWNSVHSELYFVKNTWPNFSKLDFMWALRNFNSRQRRFGK
eukprot:TRINITY_DN7766_c0_g1_i1.p1 TRINITY_DN7766_c0_g1~~TRINITY_DN7766_c0_g1_i1.p1  ORF type:complete len:301 (+),score=53.66 TRINITY_DN7766_c0_g1_i1:146-1048(+)